MTRPGYSTASFYRLILVMLVIFCIWLALSCLGVTRYPEAAIANLAPGWLIWANLVALPCMVPLASGALRISLQLRAALLVLTFLSAIMLEICFRRYPWLSGISLLLMLLEAYWIIPRWNSQHRP
jgi:hypothetical protein